VVERLIDTRRFAIESFLVTPAARAALEHQLASAGAEVLVCSPTVLEQVTGFNFHRGCLALAQRPTHTDDTWLDADQTVMALDGVGNPDNVGSLFRTASALGVAGVVVTDSCADPLYRKAVRTSMGAVLQLPWIGVPDAIEAIARLRGRGYQVAALTPRDGAMAINRFASLRLQRAALLLGSEGQGLEGPVLEAADYRVRIPQASGIDSLNVTVAAGIALHVLAARRPA